MNPVLDSFSQSPLVRYITHIGSVNKSMYVGDVTEEDEYELPFYKYSRVVTNREGVFPCNKYGAKNFTFTKGTEKRTCTQLMGYWTSAPYISYEVPAIGFWSGATLSIRLKHDYALYRTFVNDTLASSALLSISPYVCSATSHRDSTPYYAGKVVGDMYDATTGIGFAKPANAIVEHNINVCRMVEKIEIWTAGMLLECVYPETIVLEKSIFIATPHKSILET